MAPKKRKAATKAVVEPTPEPTAAPATATAAAPAPVASDKVAKTADAKDVKQASAPVTTPAPTAAAASAPTASASASTSAPSGAAGGGGGAVALPAGTRVFGPDDVQWPWMEYSAYGGSSFLSAEAKAMPSRKLRIRPDAQLVHDAFPTASDGAALESVDPALSAACADIQKQIRSWGSMIAGGHGSDGEEGTGGNGDEATWASFFVPNAVLTAAGLAADTVTLEQAIVALFSVPVTKRAGSTEQHAPVTVRAEALKDTRETFWPGHFYFYDGRPHAKKLALVKAGTNKIKKYTEKNSCYAFKFEDERSNMFGWGVMIAGWAKKAVGGRAIVITTYADGCEEHVHHGK